MEQVLARLLLEHAPLAALVDDRVDWDQLQQGAVGPAIVMHLISDIPGYHMAGPDGLIDARVQFDCRGSSADEARQVSDALNARLSGYRGVFHGVKFNGAFRLATRGRSDKDGASEIFTRSSDYRIWFGQAA